MSWKALVIIFYVLVTLSPAFALEIPDQCKGQQVYCEYSVSACTLAYCPEIHVYDKDGRYAGIKNTGCSNTCTYTRQCHCDSYSWTEITPDEQGNYLLN